MAGKTDIYENDLLKLIFNNVDIALIGDAAGIQNSVAAGSLYFSLHSTEPLDTATTGQSTNEVAYTGYARVGKLRATGAGGFTVTGNSVSPFDAVTFGACTAGTATANWFGLGTDSTGNGKLLYYGAVSPAISISNGVTPQLTTATAITED